jgi:hypothetical protein
MRGIGTRTAGPEVGGAADDAAPAAEERRLNLLRQISLAGGSVSPVPDPQALRGYGFGALGDDVEPDLGNLGRRGYLEARFFDRVSLCPKCDSHHLNVREICPGCRRAHVSSEGLLHHFRCGYVGIPSEFVTTKEGSYVCPKCNGRMDHPGTQYDRLGKAFLCRSCGLISENPPVEAACFGCGARTPAEDLVSAIVFSYVLTSRGAAAIRRGSLLDGDDEPVAVADAPSVYRRAVIVEFLESELRRLQHFNTGFSLLLAECAQVALEQRGDDAPAQWLMRLRECLREVDVLGQLADCVYVVLLPQTKKRAAEAMRQQILDAMGPQFPFTLSTIEITEPRHLAQVLAGRNALNKPR